MLLAGAIAEPRPYTVPTSTATDALPVVRPAGLVAVEADERSVAWLLIRLWDEGRALAVQWDKACDGASVHVQETPESVTVQVLATGEQQPDCWVGGRTIVHLGAPLDERPLLHAATTATPPKQGGRTLAEFYADPPSYPGDPWFRDGREVTRSEFNVAGGPEHCGWEKATFLAGTALQAQRDERGPLWARDPDGILEHFPAAQAGFRAGITVPEQAVFSGYSRGPLQVWTVPSDFEFVYVVNTAVDGDVERWVRGGGGCA